MDHIRQERVKSRDAVTTGDDISDDVNIDSTLQKRVTHTTVMRSSVVEKTYAWWKNDDVEGGCRVDKILLGRGRGKQEIALHHDSHSHQMIDKVP